MCPGHLTQHGMRIHRSRRDGSVRTHTCVNIHQLFRIDSHRSADIRWLCCFRQSVAEYVLTALTTLHQNLLFKCSPEQAAQMETVFMNIGSRYTRTSASYDDSTKLNSFILMFGVTPFICEKLWDRLQCLESTGTRPSHLLWTLCFLKC